MKKKSLLFIVITVSILAGCQKSGTELKGNSVQEITVSASSELSTIDGALAMENTAVEVMNQIGEGLFYVDSEGNVKPALAQEMVEPSLDGLTYRIKLRKDGKWSNGKSITAKDFEYSWKRAISLEEGKLNPYFEGILNYDAIIAGKMEAKSLGIKALSNYELEITLEEPMSYFLSILTLPSFFPLNQNFVEKMGNDYGTSSDTTMYNGPFIMKKWDGISDEWHYEKNTEYWDKRNVKLNAINVKVIKESQTASNLFDNFQMDVVKINGNTVEGEINNPNVYTRQLSGTYHLMFNVTNKLFINKNVRKAIDLSIDSEELASKILRDGSSKSRGFVPQGFINKETGRDFTEESGDLKRVNKKRAKELWAQAKHELGIESGNVVLLSSDADNMKKVSEYIQSTITENLEGLNVSILNVPLQNRIDKSQIGDYDFVISGWTPVYADPIDFLNLFIGDNPNNYSRWKNSTYDTLIKKATNSSVGDYQQRWDTLVKLNQILAADVPTTPLFQMSEVFLINPNLVNVTIGPLGTLRYKEVYLNDK